MDKAKQTLKHYWWVATIAAIVIVLTAAALLVTSGTITLPGGFGGPKQEPEEEPLPAWGWNEIIRHHERDDCWVVVDVRIYDISDWEYPGEADIADACGILDASKYFSEAGRAEPPAELQIGVYPKYGLEIREEE
ncbi:hypothetical protein F4X86_02010 [Candidatus Saccharibacteria bacterium]|nr:hypothetical protein [Candidatus Saccharibacteria bacterium]